MSCPQNKYTRSQETLQKETTLLRRMPLKVNLNETVAIRGRCDDMVKTESANREVRSEGEGYNLCYGRESFFIFFPVFVYNRSVILHCFRE